MPLAVACVAWACTDCPKWPQELRAADAPEAESAPADIRALFLPLDRLRAGDWALFEGQQPARGRQLAVTVRLTALEKTDSHVLVERHMVNETAKTLPEEEWDDIWLSWKDRRTRLLFHLKGGYTPYSLFVDPPRGGAAQAMEGREPRVLDCAEAEGIETTGETLAAAGKEWNARRHVYKTPFKPPAPPPGMERPRPRPAPGAEKPQPPPMPKILETWTEWRHDEVPFGLLRADMNMGAGVFWYDYTLAAFGGADDPAPPAESPCSAP
jgi:hypothetical protein